MIGIIQNRCILILTLQDYKLLSGTDLFGQYVIIYCGHLLLSNIKKDEKRISTLASLSETVAAGLNYIYLYVYM